MLIVATGDVAGDNPPAGQAGPAPEQDALNEDPSVQYELGPGKILYEDQTPEEQTNLDRMEEITAASQDGTSNDAFARAAQQAAETARVESASRQLGLIGSEEQGVIP